MSVELQPQQSQVSLLGLPFHPFTLSQAINHIENAIETKTSCFISTPNLNFTILAQHNAPFYDAVLNSDLVVADGMPIIWVAKFLGLPIKERIAGSDLFDLLSKKPRAQKIRVFFFGGEQGVAALAAEQLNKISVGMEACGFIDPGFVSVEQMTTETIRQQINQAKPDFLVVALGAQKGQQWIMQNKAYLNAPVISHLGAVINFVAGKVERAPVLWQKLGLEWVWRIKQEPKLYKRYLMDGLSFIKMFFSRVIPLKFYVFWLSQITAYDARTAIIKVVDNNKLRQEIKVAGWLSSKYLPELNKIIEQVLLNNDEICIDGAELIYLDATIIARFCILQAQINDTGKKLILKDFSPKAVRLLQYSSVIKNFTLI